MEKWSFKIHQGKFALNILLVFTGSHWFLNGCGLTNGCSIRAHQHPFIMCVHVHVFHMTRMLGACDIIQTFSDSEECPGKLRCTATSEDHVE